MSQDVKEKSSSFLYTAPVEFFGSCKKLFDTSDGLSSVAGVALAIFTLMDLKSRGFSPETIDILTGHANAIQTVKGGTGWASASYEILTKPWGKIDTARGWIGNIKRITGIASSILSVNTYLDKIKAPNFTDYLPIFGGVTVRQITSIFSTTLGLIENGMDLYDNHQELTKLTDKRIALIKSNVAAPSEEELNLAHNKLASKTNIILAELEVTNTEVKYSMGQINALKAKHSHVQEQLAAIEIDEVINGKNITRKFKSDEGKRQFNLLSTLLNEIVKDQNKLHLVVKIAHLRKKVVDRALNPSIISEMTTVAKVKQLTLALKLLENPDILALKDVKVLLKREGAFVDYKNVKYAIREVNLNIKRTETYWSIASNVLSFALIALGLNKAYFGAEAVMKIFNIKTEDWFEKINASVSIITGGIGIRKYLYAEIPIPEPRVAEVLNSSPKLNSEDQLLMLKRKDAYDGEKI